MSEIYGDGHRALQNHFQTRKLADRLEDLIVSTQIDEGAELFIKSQDMFFLSTVGGGGQPTVSYKGGAPGFVNVVDEKTLAFPSYDGNGMFMSMGNIAANPKIGMLFINFETPHRLRVHGEASVDEKDALLDNYPEADLIVRVAVSKIWINCPRYIHRHEKVTTSPHVPKSDVETPVAQWKRIDIVQDALPPKDADVANQGGGPITIDEYMEKVQKGEG